MRFPFKTVSIAPLILIIFVLFPMLWFFVKAAWMNMKGVWLVLFETVMLACAIWIPARRLYYAYGSLKMPRQFIELRDGEIYWQIFPTGIGKMPYAQIRFVGLDYWSNRGRASNGKLFITYQPPKQPENFQNWQTITLNLNYIRSKIQILSAENEYLKTITQLQYELIKRIPPEQLITELEWEKRKTRVWLDSFKNKT